MNYGDLELSEEEGMRYGQTQKVVEVRIKEKGVDMKKFLNWLLVILTLAVVGGVLFYAYGCVTPKPKPPGNPCATVTCPINSICKPTATGVECTAVVVPPPEPPVEPPLAPFCTKGRLAGRFHPYLQGIDATWVCVGDHDFCESVGLGFWPDGSPRYDCAFGGDETEIRHQREKTLGCPAVYWSETRDGAFRRCTSAPNATGMSCDHWDLHNVPPYGCAPDTGFFSIPQGRGFLKVCSLVKPDVCSDIQFYEQQ